MVLFDGELFLAYPAGSFDGFIITCFWCQGAPPKSAPGSCTPRIGVGKGCEEVRNLIAVFNTSLPSIVDAHLLKGTDYWGSRLLCVLLLLQPENCIEAALHCCHEK